MRYLRFGKRSTQLEEGTRIYAIGDVHGCYDLLANLVQLIELDGIQRGPANTKLILLGDIIDRGTKSREVVELLYQLHDAESVICLKGNHEQTMVDVLRGDLDAMRFWMSFGGVETLLSWGLDRDLVIHASLGESWQRELLQAFRAAVPPEIVRWMANLPVCHREGDYFFVHAGVRPGTPLDAQSEEDMMWIREPFLNSWRQHEAVVVHGHTEHPTAVLNPNRIGLDTAAYRTGCLTAIGLEGGNQWVIDTAGKNSLRRTEAAELKLATA